VGADPNHAGEFKRAVHGLGESAREHQAEPGAAFTTGVRAEAIEGHEQPSE
jgi:hypothetical protein